MRRFTIICLVILLIGSVGQHWIPTFGASFYNAKFLLLPLLFFCVVHGLPYITTLCFALLTGFLWDAEHVLAPFPYEVDLGEESVDNLKFGYSLFLFGIIGFLIKFTQSNFKYKGSIVYVFTVFFSFLFYLILENVCIVFVRGFGGVSYKIFFQILLTSLFSSIPCLLVLKGLSLVWKLLKTRESGLITHLDRLIGRNYR